MHVWCSDDKVAMMRSFEWKAGKDHPTFYLPHGTEIWLPFEGKNYYASIDQGALVYCDTVCRSPWAFMQMVKRQVRPDADVVRVGNPLMELRLRSPGQKDWVRADKWSTSHQHDWDGIEIRA